LWFNTRSGIIHENLDENATEEEKKNRRVWLYRIGTVSDEYDLTEAVFQKKQTRIFIETTTIPTEENPVKIELIDF
jgi:DNA repair photolyase